MAKKHIKELISKTKGYFERLNNLDSEAVRISTTQMVDPESWSKITLSLRELAQYLSNVNSLLSMALYPRDFIKALNSRRNLVKSIKEVLCRVKTEQPDLPLIGEYEKVLNDHNYFLSLLEETELFRGYPKAKKKYSNWNKKGLIKPEYLPFVKVESGLLEISKSLSEEV